MSRGISRRIRGWLLVDLVVLVVALATLLLSYLVCWVLLNKRLLSLSPLISVREHVLIRLMVFDAGGTLGCFIEPGTKEILGALSPLPRHVVAEEARRFLHCEPLLTEGLIEDICGALLIDREDWPTPWPASGFTVFPDAHRVLGELTAEFNVPIIVLSNIPVTCGPRRMSDLLEQLHPHIAEVYTSYSTRRRKPDPRLWAEIARQHGVRPHEIVHVGNQWTTDIRGAVKAGCHAIYHNPDRPPPPEHEWPAGRDVIGLANQLHGVVPLVRAFHTTSYITSQTQRRY